MAFQGRDAQGTMQIRQADEEYDYEAVQEDEFKNRDAQGLKISEEEPTEEEEMKKYAVMLLLIFPLIKIGLALGIYFLVAKAFEQEDLYNTKFKFLHDWQLGYVYLAVSMIWLMRHVIVINANAARGGARVDRPDQHVYKIMDKDGPNRIAPFVMMANTGAQGRFNRAQRGVFNTDEALPLVLAATLLTGFVFGPVVCVVLLLSLTGRIIFACKYKESSDARGAGFMPAVIGEGILEGLVFLCAVKGIFYPRMKDL